MNGAWESESPSVLVGILTREIVSMKWAMGFRNLMLPPSSGITVRSGAPYDVARNAICADALQHHFQWIFFVDDDVISPPDVYMRLVKHDLDIVSGLYYRRHEPICPVAMKTDDTGKHQWVTAWSPPNSMLEVDLVGAGCLLIHRRVLERMSPPWFEWQIGREPAQVSGAAPKRGALSEDFAFCVKAKEAGFKVHLDTSIRCDHVGLGQATPDGDFRPSGLP